MVLELTLHGGKHFFSVCLGSNLMPQGLALEHEGAENAPCGLQDEKAMRNAGRWMGH